MPQFATHSARRESRAAPQADLHLRFTASVIVGAIVVAAIYFGRPVLVPLALAILLAFALAPIVSFLEGLHVGRAISVALASLFALAVIGALVLFIGTQLANLAADLPRYQHNISGKIHALVNSATSNAVIGRTSSLLSNLGNQISSTPSMGRVAARGTMHALAPNGTQTPIPVEIRQPAATPLQIIENIFRPLLDPLATAGIAIIFVIFILLQKEDLRDRFIWMAGSGDLQRAKVALDDGASRLSSFLLTQTGINTVFGALIGAGLWLIAVPHPWLWGLVAGIFRFVPYVGVPLAAVMPIVLSLAVDPGWTMVFWTTGLYLVLEPVVSQFIEPFAYGHSVGLSPVAVVVAATFWTWVWGPIGLLLSTPLTLCLAVMGRHVERLRFLDVLLGDTPPLAHEESVYLRILAGDPDDAARFAESSLKEHSLCEYCDIALKTLVLAQADIDRGALDAERSAEVKQTIEELIENLSDSLDAGAAAWDEARSGAHKIFTAETLPAEWVGQPVLCVAGRGDLDEAAALLLVYLLERHGIGARVVQANRLSPANVADLDPSSVRFICLSYLQAGSGTNAHYVMRRLRRRISSAHAITGFWGLSNDNSRVLDAIGATHEDVATDFEGALSRIIAAIENSRRAITTAADGSVGDGPASDEPESARRGLTAPAD
jgi:predicted PurR-regulated permease PerM